MERLTLTKQQARRFILAHQGLGSSYEFTGKKGVLDYIKLVGCIQYDALNIVGRNPELVLQSRIKDYHPSMLYELLYKERRLLDGIDKEMSIYCIEDWPYFHRNRQVSFKRFGNTPQLIKDYLPQIRQKIEDSGPLSSHDLKLNQIVDWSWSPTRLSRAALESMYHWGELIVHHKVNTRKVYDFTHRHITKELIETPDPNRTEKQYHDWCIMRRIGAVGLLWGKSGDAWRGIQRIKSAERDESVTRLLKKGKIIEVQVKGIKYPLYMRVTEKKRLESALEQSDTTPRAAILAPLDNMLWDRQFVQELFGFEYRWEVYKPINERKHGYYVLPVLYGDRFIARFEPGKDKENGALVINNWWWEPGINHSKTMQQELQRCFTQFLKYLGTDKLEIDGRLAEKEGLEWMLRKQVC